MSNSMQELSSRPRLLALFQKRIGGDDALLKLAGLRFSEAGLGMECYAETPDELRALLTFKPAPESPVTVHLPRQIDLFDPGSRSLILEFARCFKGEVFGLVVHDQPEAAVHFDGYVDALHRVETGLREIGNPPYLFVEYAAGLEPELFIKLLKAIRDFEWVSGCIDTGHLGLWYVRKNYSRKYPGEDVCALTPLDSRLPEVIEDVRAAMCSAADEVLYVIQELARLGKPLHFHLHDGHPLSTLSPFGVSDHLSFLNEIPIPFEYRGKKSLRPMYGPSGLSKMVTKSLKFLGPDQVSLCLEIHPTEGRLPLGNAAHLFDHWTDKGNAERMNFWLSVLAHNHVLLSEICEKNCNHSHE